MPGERPEDLFAARLRAAPESPLVGWYAPPPAGARMELSARSLGTWAAKTVGLLADDLGLAPGARVRVELPSHWIGVGLAAGVWAAGGELLTAAAPGPADVAVVTAGALATARPDADEILVVDPDSAWQLGGVPGLGADPAVRDLVLALRPHPDLLPGGGFPADPADPAVDGLSRRDLVARARARATGLGLDTAGVAPRAVWTGGITTAGDLLDAVLAPWALGGSLVLAPGADPARAADVARAEHATHVLG